MYLLDKKDEIRNNNEDSRLDLHNNFQKTYA